MPSYWIVVIAGSIIIGIVISIKVYWSILLAFFPARERAAEVHTVTTRDMWEIKLFRYRRGRTSGEPVLLVHGAAVNHKNFTEPEGACLVDALVARGFDCWAIDMRTCQSAKPAFERKKEDASIDDVLQHDLPAAIRYIRKSTSYGRVHWVGHSLGGMLLYAYAQQFGTDHIASGTTLGSPIGFQGTNLRIKRVPGLVRAYPHEMGNVFRALIPPMFYIGIRTILFPINAKNLHPRLGPGNLFHVVEDAAPRALAELIGWASTKTWKMLGGKLDVLAGLKSIDLPLLAFYAPRDPFAPPAAGRAFFEALPNPDKRMVLLSKENGCQHDYDHCDIAFGVDAPRVVFEPIARWIEDHPITERVRAEELEDDEAAPRAALDLQQRVSILAGLGAAASAPALAAVRETPAPAGPIEPAPVELVVERIPEEPAPAKVAKPVVAGKPVTKAKAKPAPKAPRPAVTKAKTAAITAKPTAAKSKAAPAARAKAAPAKAKPAPAAEKAPAKATAKPKTSAPKLKAMPKLAAKPKIADTPKPKAKPKSSAKPQSSATRKPKPPVKAKPVPQQARAVLAKAKAALAKPKAAAGTPRVKLPPSKAERNQPSALTKNALLAASEALKSLDGKK